MKEFLKTITNEDIQIAEGVATCQSTVTLSVNTGLDKILAILNQGIRSSVSAIGVKAWFSSATSTGVLKLKAGLNSAGLSTANWAVIGY